MRGLLRAAGTALLAGTVVLRTVRALWNLESVLAYYGGAAGLFWKLLYLAAFLGPYLTTAAAMAALWLPRLRARQIGSWSLCAAAFFSLWEGLTVFARAMDGHGGYVGAEPLFSLLVLGISAVFCARRKRETDREEGTYVY